MAFPKKTLLSVMVVAVYVLHQDWWNWDKHEPVLFGFLPVGLTYHALYSIAASIMMAVVVKLAWPRHLESTRPADVPADRAKGDRS